MTTTERLLERVRPVMRTITAIVVGTALGTLAWMAIEQVSKELNLTDVDFARSVALELGTEGSRQDIGLAGLAGSLVVMFVVLVAHAAIGERLMAGRRLIVRALPMALVLFLIWGLILSPRRPSGTLGLDSGIGTPLTFAVAAVAAAAFALRVYTLVRSADWWRTKDITYVHGFDEDRHVGSLELPEEGSEESRVRTGG